MQVVAPNPLRRSRGGALYFAFLARSQVMPILLVRGPHFRISVLAQHFPGLLYMGPSNSPLYYRMFSSISGLCSQCASSGTSSSYDSKNSPQILPDVLWGAGGGGGEMTPGWGLI